VQPAESGGAVTESSRDVNPFLRLSAIAIAAVVTVLYVVVGAEIVKVDGVAEVETGPAVPLLIAAGAFGVLTIALALHPRPFVYLAGIALDVLVIVGYFVVAPSRHPSFEVWGLSIKAIELGLLVVLTWLAIRRGVEEPEVADLQREPALH
jgi:hypothetical protein